MNISPPRALTAVQWVTGIAVLVQSSLLLSPANAARTALHSGVPHWLPQMLAAAEITAAVLFLIPATVVAGGRALLAVFAVAALIHFAHGQHDGGVLAVYAAAVLAVVADRQSGRAARRA
jgi:hypothetical protein